MRDALPLLPVRLSGATPKQVEVELSASLRLRFEEGLAVAPVDLRRGHDGLSGMVRGQGGMDLFAEQLFVFLGRRGDRCKILFWDRGGLVLHYKRRSRS